MRHLNIIIQFILFIGLSASNVFAGSTTLNSKYNLVPSPPELVVWALEDAEADFDSGIDVRGYRYIWIHSKEERDCIENSRVIDLAPLNMVLSKSSNIIKSHRVNSRLLRVDLLRLGTSEEKGLKLIETWEKLKDLDHYFTVGDGDVILEEITIIEDTDVMFGETVIGKAEKDQKFKIVPFKSNSPSNDGWTQIEYESGQNGLVKSNLTKTNKSEGDRVIGPQCGTAGKELSELLNTNIPVVMDGTLLRSSMHGDIVLRPLGQDGGLYYEFLQLEEAKEGETDQQAFLRTFGASLEDSQRLKSDIGSIMLRSNVTGRSRGVTAIRGRIGKPGVSDGVIYGTFDGKDGDDFNNELDIIENVLDIKYQASEWIAPLPNGLHAYALFNGNFENQKQEIQFFAPDDVATDRTVPRPHGTRLVVGMCWRCHNISEKEDGFKSLSNELRTLLSKGRDIYTSNVEDADTIASRYSSDITKALQISRDNFANAVYKATSDIDNNNLGMEPFEAFGRLAKLYNDYWYEMVTPETALLDLGFVMDENANAARELKTILNLQPVGESAAITYLASGISINRWQWENVYPEAIVRAQNFIVELEKEVKDIGFEDKIKVNLEIEEENENFINENIN